jgi:hypothetical protein
MAQPEKMENAVARFQGRAHEQDRVRQRPQKGSGLGGATVDDGCT